jgi:hypothetical protein
MGKSDEDWGQLTKTDGRLTNKQWKNSEKYEKAMKIEDNFCSLSPIFIAFPYFSLFFTLCSFYVNYN